MDVVYLFCEFGVTRVPLFGYDERLFRLCVGQGGEWDRVCRQFIFRHGINSEQFSQNPGIVFVRVEKNSPVPVSISGFLGRPWEQAADDTASKQEASVCADVSLAVAPTFQPLPEKFPEHWQIKLEDKLRSRKYSPRTMRSYVYYNRLLCQTIQKTPEEILPEDTTQFLATVEKARKYSTSSLNLAISAIKFFYTEVMRNKSIVGQHRPRQDGRLPVILSRDEINKILEVENNPKHRLLLMLAYSSGLRVSEVVALKRGHIDIDRKTVYVRLGKGRKDRHTLLSDKVAGLLAEYCAFIGTETWLFPGQPASRHLSVRSAQYVFEKALRRAEVPKKASIHSLRHTFATHLLENGTDIRYIQELLGHNSIRTTERYTHVARRGALRIRSPLDDPGDGEG